MILNIYLALGGLTYWLRLQVVTFIAGRSLQDGPLQILDNYLKGLTGEHMVESLTQLENLDQIDFEKVVELIQQNYFLLFRFTSRLMKNQNVLATQTWPSVCRWPCCSP